MHNDELLANFLAQRRCSKRFEKVFVRGEIWWDESGLENVVKEIPGPPSLHEWIKQLAIQSWAEGAVTGVLEYGDELRAIGMLLSRNEDDDK